MEREREREIQRERQRGRMRQRERERKIERKRERDSDGLKKTSVTERDDLEEIDYVTLHIGDVTYNSYTYEI